MSLYEALVKNEENLSLVGLGYVGMPIAHAFAKKGINVIGFDLNNEKIKLYKSGVDPTKEVGDEEIKNTKIHFTSDESDLKNAKFHIVAVPTPVNTDHTPDLTPVIGASEIVGRNLVKDSIVVYESTVSRYWRSRVVLSAVWTLRLVIAPNVSIPVTGFIVWRIFTRLFQVLMQSR